MVKFSGTFLPGTEGDCLRESSLSLNGKIRSPEPRVALKCAFEAIHATYNWYRQDGPMSREAVVNAVSAAITALNVMY